MTPIARLPTHPRPKLVASTPAPAVDNGFAPLTPEVKRHQARIDALNATLKRSLSGPYTTTSSLLSAADLARLLADEANALDSEIRKGWTQ